MPKSYNESEALDYLRLIIFLHVVALRPVMCSFMLICQCCFAIVKVLLKKVTYLLTYLLTYLFGGTLNVAQLSSAQLLVRSFDP